MNTSKSTFTLRNLTVVMMIMALFAIAPNVVASPASGEPGAGLFSDSPTEGDLDRSDDPTIIRARFVDINFDLLAAVDAPQDQSEVRAAVALNLFDDVVFTALLDRLELNRSGSYSWIGHLEGVAHSQAILVVKDRVMAGNIRLPGALYQVRYAGGGVHALYQIDQAAFPPEAEPIAVDTDAPEAPDVAPTDDGSLIDAMVVYTAEARQAEGGTTAMETLIDLAVTETNTAYSNSQVAQRLNLIHAAEVTYTETGDSGTDLNRLRDTSDGYMDDVHTWRDTYKADVVSLFVDSMSGCGRAYVMTTLSPSFESSAFCVVKRTCATGNYSYGHELGHNMGCAHDRANSSVAGVYDYSYGYQDPAEEFRTIMAYDCPAGCPRIQYFSNPDVTYNGKPTGVDYTAPEAADNARTLNNTAYTVANFRVRNTQVPTAPTNLTATASSPTQIDLSWADNSSDESGFKIERSPNGSSGWTQIDTVGYNVETYSNTGLVCGTIYYYRVRAYNANGDSSYSNVANATTQTCPSLSITKVDGPDPVQPGGLLTYTLTVANSSGLADGWERPGQVSERQTLPYDIMVTDTVPMSTTCCASIGQGGTYIAATNMVVWSVEVSPTQGGGAADDWARPGQVSSRQTLPTLPVTLTLAVTVDKSVAGGAIITNDDYGVMITNIAGVTPTLGSPVTTAVIVRWAPVHLPLIQK